MNAAEILSDWRWTGKTTSLDVDRFTVDIVESRGYWPSRVKDQLVAQFFIQGLQSSELPHAARVADEFFFALLLRLKELNPNLTVEMRDDGVQSSMNKPAHLSRLFRMTKPSE